MATIITTHGTFNSGPATGKLWWQGGSQFERELRHYVKSADGEIEFKPHIWDGLNSERSRRSAGDELSNTLVDLDKKAQPFIVLGHSHGGSVIDVALKNCASRHINLSNMSRWITIGTPFISYKKSGWLYGRLPLWAKLVYSSALSATLIAMMQNVKPSSDAETAAAYYVVVLPLLVLSMSTPFLLVVSFLHLVDKRRHRLLHENVSSFCSREFGEKWTGLSHRQDEAVLSCSTIPKAKPSIFTRHFAVGPISSISVLLLIPLFAMMADGKTSAPAEPPNALGRTIGTLAKSYVDTVVAFSKSSFSFPFDFIVLTVGLMLLLVAACLALNIVIVSLAAGIGIFGSRWLKDRLDAAAWTQISHTILGNDLNSEAITSVKPAPGWHKAAHAVELPAILQLRLSNSTGESLSSTIARMRSIFQDITTAIDCETGVRYAASCLTWDELVHTYYFKEELFRKYIYAVIAHSEGFLPTEHLLADPDYVSLREWVDHCSIQSEAQTVHRGRES